MLHASSICTALTGFGRELATKGRRWLAMRRLQRLDDRALADIAVNRGEIEFVTRYGRDGIAVLSGPQHQAHALAALHFPPL